MPTFRHRRRNAAARGSEYVIVRVLTVLWLGRLAIRALRA